MDGADRVGSGKARADVSKIGDALLGGEDGLGAEAIGEGLPDEPIHDDINGAVGHLIEVVDFRDRRVFDARLDVSLATQARDFTSIGCGGAAEAPCSA